jgi:hypothetical protein
LKEIRAGVNAYTLIEKELKDKVIVKEIEKELKELNITLREALILRALRVSIKMSK